MRQAARGDDRLQVKAEVIHEAEPEEERSEIKEAGDPDGRSDAEDEDRDQYLKEKSEAAKASMREDDPNPKEKSDPASGLFNKGVQDAAGEAEKKFRGTRGK
jgi:hypothetical protein